MASLAFCPYNLWPTWPQVKSRLSPWCLIASSFTGDDFSFVWADELPRGRALAGQEASKEFTYIKYHDREVTVLKKDGPEFTLVSWHGRTVRVPNEAIDRDHPGRLNTDYTDYLLPVRAGDVLSLVREAGGMRYVRKDSVLGWYRGPVGPVDDAEEIRETPLLAADT